IPLRFGRDGTVELIGSPEEVERELVLDVRGYRPRTHRFAHRLSAGSDLARDEIRLELGLTRKLVLRSETGEIPFEGTTIAVRRLDGPGLGQIWPVSSDGSASISGLVAGRYHVAVEGPLVAPFETEVTIHESRPDDVIRSEERRVGKRAR